MGSWISILYDCGTHTRCRCRVRVLSVPVYRLLVKSIGSSETSPPTTGAHERNPLPYCFSA